MLAPLIGVGLTLTLYFSSYSIIQQHTHALKQLSESNLPHISRLSHFTVSLSDNESKLSNLLLNAEQTLDEEQVFLQSKAIVNQLYQIEAEFNLIFSTETKNTNKQNLYDRFKHKFINYKKAVLDAIEASTVDVKYAKRELVHANNIRQSLNTDVLLLSEYHTQNLADASTLIDESLHDKNDLLIITIFLIFLMLLISLWFANHLAISLGNIHKNLLNLSAGKTSINFPKVKDRYLEAIYKAVYKFKDTLQRNESQQIELENALETIKDSEQRYYGMLQLIPTGLVALDNERKIVLFNQAAELIFGYKSNEVIGQPLAMLIPDNDISISNKGALPLIESKTILSGNTVTGVSKQGEEIKLEASQAHISLTNEDMTAIAVTDVTQRNKMDKTLRRAQKMDAVGQLCGGISHDFNNILNIILGNIDLLDLRINDESLKKYTSTIRKSTRRAADLTNKLLGFSRDQPTELSITNINDVINDLKGLIARSLTPEVEVYYHLEGDLKPVNIDIGDFEDSLINLVLNARDAMPEGGKLTIETRNRLLDESYCAQHHGTTPGEHVELCVSDNGQGISSEQIEHVFEPFYTTKEKGKGTGLGLAMVFGFISRSKATINIYSEENIGTAFKMYFPVSVRKQENVKDNNAESIMPRGNETILVVDDEEGLRNLAQETLQNLGYTVLTANDASQAIDIYSNNRNIDLLFTDVVMPGGVNGYQLAEQLIELEPELKILLTSGYTEKALSNNEKEKFNSSLITKPYNLTLLAEQVRNTLDS